MAVTDIANAPQTRKQPSPEIPLDNDSDDDNDNLLDSPSSSSANPDPAFEPLLSSPQCHNQQRTFSSSTLPSLLPHPTHDTRLIIGLLCTVIFILAFGGGLMAVPCLRLWEQILCHYHYDKLEGELHRGFEDVIEEKLCKIADVQEKLNLLLAGLWFIGTLPALFTTIPYGLLADRVGRRVVFALSLTGMILAGLYNFTIMSLWKVLPLQMIWGSPIFLIIGGGEAVTTMMFYAIGNDITSEKNRTNIFLLGGVAILVAQLLSPSIASALMAKNPWIPIWLGMGLLIFGTSLIVFIPETLHLKLASTEESTREPLNNNPSTKTNNASFYTAVKTNVSEASTRLYGATKILHSLPIVLLLTSFVTDSFARVSGDMSLRYISNRYGWELRQAGFLLSLRAFINILLLLAIVPSISHVLTSRLGFTTKAKDLLLAQVSSILLVVGATLIGLAPTAAMGIIAMIIWTLGTGFSALTRSLITTLVEKQHVGRLYAAIQVIEVISAMAAGPTQSAFYALGLKWKGTWQGLPYFCLAFIYAVAGCAVFAFAWLMNKGDGEIRLGDEDEDDLVDEVALETEDEDGRRVGVV